MQELAAFIPLHDPGTKFSWNKDSAARLRQVLLTYNLASIIQMRECVALAEWDSRIFPSTSWHERGWSKITVGNTPDQNMTSTFYINSLDL